MHAGKSGESTPAATKGRRRLGHRLTLWLVQATDYRLLNEPPRPRLQRKGTIFLMARPPLLGQGGKFRAPKNLVIKTKNDELVTQRQKQRSHFFSESASNGFDVALKSLRP